MEMIIDSGYKTPITRNCFEYLGMDGWKTLKYLLPSIKTFWLSHAAQGNN